MDSRATVTWRLPRLQLKAVKMMNLHTARLQLAYSIYWGIIHFDFETAGFMLADAMRYLKLFEVHTWKSTTEAHELNLDWIVRIIKLNARKLRVALESA